MKYDGLLDTWHEECGVFGLYDRTLPMGTTIYKGLMALQHRGQEGAGIAVVHESQVDVVKGSGLVKEALRDVSTLEGHIGIGHVRYSTTGIKSHCDVQPIVGASPWGALAVAHNGNITNAQVLRGELESQGSVFTTTMDSEVIVHLICQSNKSTILEAIQQACARLEGAFSLTITTNTMLIGVRDSYGYRPLCVGRTTHGYVLASESCAIDAIEGTFIRDITPGEMMTIDATGCCSIPYYSNENTQHTCVFEYIYFAHPTSVIDGQGVLEARDTMGRQLAKKHGMKRILLCLYLIRGLCPLRDMPRNLVYPIGKD